MSNVTTTLVMEERIKECAMVKRLVKRNGRRTVRLELVRFAHDYDPNDQPISNDSVIAEHRFINAQ